MILNVVLFCCCNLSFSDDILPPSQLILSSTAILAKEYVSSTIHIPGGYYSSPYIINSYNTEYILDGDIIAASTGIAIRSSKVVLDLNGHAITYNELSPGEGVYVDGWNLTDIAIHNGSIIQGTAMSEGDQYGDGNNPIRGNAVSRLQIARINAVYGGRDISGFEVTMADSIVEENTIKDIWSFGTFKNRHQGTDCIDGSAGLNNIFRNNILVNCRQRGIQTNNGAQVYGNNITINSLGTNSYGIFGWSVQNVKVHDNTIVGRGEHPLGIGFVNYDTENIEIYNNSIDVQTTRIGEEYAGATCFDPSTPCGNYAIGFRSHRGANNLNFHHNTISVTTNSAFSGSYSPTGEPVLVNGKGRGLMIGSNPGLSATYANNTVTVLDADGTGDAFGLVCTAGDNEGVEQYNMHFIGNTVTSNIANVVLGDSYGACEGYPLFKNNTFIKADNYPAYNTIASKLDGWYMGTGLFVDNVFQSGASRDSIDIQPGGASMQSVYFGHDTGAEDLYDYQIHDNNNSSSVLLRTDYAPPISDPTQ